MRNIDGGFRLFVFASALDESLFQTSFTQKPAFETDIK